jgi:hypothetical protein
MFKGYKKYEKNGDKNYITEHNDFVINYDSNFSFIFDQ